MLTFWVVKLWTCASDAFVAYCCNVVHKTHEKAFDKIEEMCKRTFVRVNRKSTLLDCSRNCNKGQRVNS